jgi:replicative DNA helicase
MVDVEKSLVAEMYADGSVIPQVKQVLTDRTWFADLKCGRYFAILCEAFDEFGIIDIHTINDRAKLAGLDAVELIEWGMSAGTGHAIVHARIIVENYTKRCAREEIVKIARALSDGEDSYETIVAGISHLNHLKDLFSRDKTVTLAQIAGEIFDEMDEIRSGKSRGVVSFGFPELDRVTGGMDPGDLVVIAAPEKAGKSTLAIQVCFHAARMGIPVMFFSSEMHHRMIFHRQLMLEESLSWVDYKRNLWTDEKYVRYSARVGRLAPLPIYVRHGVFNIADIMAESEKYVRHHRVGLIVVDYIQRVVPVGKKANENREREVAAISSGLKSVAMEYQIPVIALSQVNDDLRARESRAIEQDMDKMITIKVGERPLGAHMYPVEVVVRQRMGVSTGWGDIKLEYDLLRGCWTAEEPRVPQRQQEAF